MAFTGFCQDSMIQLYDTGTRNYINLIHDNAWGNPALIENNPIEILRMNKCSFVNIKN